MKALFEYYCATACLRREQMTGAYKIINCHRPAFMGPFVAVLRDLFLEAAIWQ